MKEKIKEQLIAATDEIFLEWSAKLHVTSGDIEPLVAFRFDTEIEKLAQTMENILEAQPKLGITKLQMLDGTEVDLSKMSLGYDETQKLVEIERYLREKEII